MNVALTSMDSTRNLYAQEQVSLDRIQTQLDALPDEQSLAAAMTGRPIDEQVMVLADAIRQSGTVYQELKALTKGLNARIKEHLQQVAPIPETVDRTHVVVMREIEKILRKYEHHDH
jgi:hypothetical protein